MALISLRRALALASLATTVSSLYFTPGSDCAALCSGSSNSTSQTSEPSISSDDVVCRDAEYTSTAEGIRFRQCIDCLRDSEEAEGDDSDIQWMLYNMRYTLNACLWEPATMVNSPCIINFACESLEDSVTAGLSTPGERHFDYCTADGGTFTDKAHGWCVECLHSSEIQVYLSNYLQTLMAACQQEPDPGNTLTMDGEIFSTELLNITVANITLPGEGGAGASDMTTGTIVGIAVGGGLGFFGLIALIWVYCRKRSKRKALEAEELEQSPPPDMSNASSFTAINHSPYLAIADAKKSPSIRSTNYEMDEKMRNSKASDVMRNGDYYDKMEEEEARTSSKPSKNYHFDPRLQQHGPGSALPAHHAYDPRYMSRKPNGHSRNNSLAPEAARKTNPSLDSYALQAYLNAHEDSLDPALRTPPTSGASFRSRPATPSGQPSPGYSVGRRSTDRTAERTAEGGNIPTPPGSGTFIPPPPPGPPPNKRNDGSSSSKGTPSIVIPSIPRIRLPKKYHPPQIVVEGATPIDGDRRPADDLHISPPITQHEKRFTDKPLGGPVPLATQAPPRPVESVDYNADIPITSGKTMLYG